MLYNVITRRCVLALYLVNVCESVGIHWHIRFNPLRSKLITFGGNAPDVVINTSGVAILSVNNYFQHIC